MLYALGGERDDLDREQGTVRLLPTPRVASPRTGRSAALRDDSMSGPSLEQALELARGEPPREFTDSDALPPSWRLLPTPRTSDIHGSGDHGEGGDDLRTAVDRLLPTPLARLGDGRGAIGARYRGAQSRNGRRSNLDDMVEAVRIGQIPWGDYEPAIRRHEHATGLPHPPPVDGKGRLAAPFVEWMMMLPAGWVTDIVKTKTAALRMLGNGVVPPAAAHALPQLLARLERQTEQETLNLNHTVDVTTGGHL